ncbi:MAG: hypothetical protein ABIG85_06845 [Chloroflexota bacterium]
MVATRLVLVPDAESAPPPAADARVVVLDTAWTPGPDDRDDLVPLRPAVSAVLAREDVIDLAIDLVDDWAARLDLHERATFRSVGWWNRRGAWRWLLGRLQWRAILDELLRGSAAAGAAIAELVLPPGEAALADAATALAAEHGLRVTTAAGDRRTGQTAARDDPRGESAGAIRLGDRVRWRLGRHPRQVRKRELDRRAELLAARAERLAAESPGRLLVLTVPLVHQRIGGLDAPLVDPFLGPIVDRLRGTRLEPITIARGLDRADDETWPAIEADERLLSDAFLPARWSTGDEGAATAVEMIGRALDAAAPADADGADVGGFGAGLLEEVRRDAGSSLPARLRQASRIERLLRELRPAGVLLYNEYGRLDWLAGARWAGVPVIAVQHGIIFPGHVGYRHARHPGLVLPACTFVFGPYEARVLRTHGGYVPDEVLVTGSPRLAPGVEPSPADPAEGWQAGPAMPPGERAEVRRELGVADGDRLLVISTTRDPGLRRFHQNHALACLLDGPLPGVHIAFKQHPAERDRGDYESLVAGLARSGGHEPPPVSVVRDVDLYRLLRAADAHLGVYSTVLTDAVAAGTPNLVAVAQARADLLDYVAAGVAVPVRTHAELLVAIQAPTVPDPPARRTFLDDHFLPGDGAARIAAALLAATERVAG